MTAIFLFPHAFFDMLMSIPQTKVNAPEVSSRILFVHNLSEPTHQRGRSSFATANILPNAIQKFLKKEKG